MDLIEVVEISSKDIRVKVNGIILNYRATKNGLVLMGSPEIHNAWKELARQRAFNIFCAWNMQKV